MKHHIILYICTHIMFACRPGLLTKAPSDALQAVARMTPTSESSDYKGMDSFFMVGVKPGQQEGEERTMTPSQNKRHKEETIKVSNRCELRHFFYHIKFWLRFRG